MSRRPGARTIRAVGGVIAIAVIALALPAAARAHAMLERAVPRDGAVLERQPDSVAFYFNESIEGSFGAVRILDAAGREVQRGSAFRPQGRGDALAVGLRPRLPDGTYTATYRIVSADSHPVSGGVTFSIGRRGGAAVSPRVREGDGGGTGHVTSAAFWADRWLGYGAIALAVGGLFFLVWAWRPALAERAGAGEAWLPASASFNRRFRALVAVAVAVGAATSLVALPLEAASAAGTSLWGALNGDALNEVAGTRFGTLMIVRAAAWALLGGVLALIASRGRMPVLKRAQLGATGIALNRPAGIELVALAMLPIGSLLVSPALAGHASTQSPEALLMPADVIHVAAMSLWLGGLVTLVVAVPAATARLAPPERARLLLGVLKRFSGVALASVVALAASGVVQAVVEVGRVGALVDTGYGRAVTAKVVLLCVLIGFGAANRERLIPALSRAVAATRGPGRAGEWLRRNVRSESVLVAGVLGVTAVLVAYAPAADDSTPAASPGVASTAAHGRVSGRAAVGDASLRYSVDPARTGLNQINLYLRRAGGGAYMRAKEVTAELSLPARAIGPLHAELHRMGPGHYVDSAAQLGVPGDWRLTVTVRTSAFDEKQVNLKVRVG